MGGTKTVKKTQGIQFAQQYRSVFVVLADDSRKLIYFPNTTEVFSIDFDGDQYEMFESMRIYIERFGRPNNYLKSNNHLHSEREQYLLEEEAKAEETAKKENEALKDNNKSPEEQENRQKKE